MSSKAKVWSSIEKWIEKFVGSVWSHLSSIFRTILKKNYQIYSINSKISRENMVTFNKLFFFFMTFYSAFSVYNQKFNSILCSLFTLKKKHSKLAAYFRVNTVAALNDFIILKFFIIQNYQNPNNVLFLCWNKKTLNISFSVSLFAVFALLIQEKCIFFLQSRFHFLTDHYTLKVNF